MSIVIIRGPRPVPVSIQQSYRDIADERRFETGLKDVALKGNKLSLTYQTSPSEIPGSTNYDVVFHGPQVAVRSAIEAVELLVPQQPA